ncbi:hypothetical protein BH745_13405 [Enterococcus gallinarum]|nr:predicted protein [Enterococcus gallinarum EG2]KIL81158.1 hypothetical protein EH68_10925 [Enterococcus gallinarum]OQO77552.1 hypothetical protein BH745_13405 [Enterococcus gallinarum]TXX23444.1 hypothetical protein D4M43_28575 [Escherichia coli]
MTKGSPFKPTSFYTYLLFYDKLILLVMERFTKTGEFFMTTFGKQRRGFLFFLTTIVWKKHVAVH